MNIRWYGFLTSLVIKFQQNMLILTLIIQSLPSVWNQWHHKIWKWKIPLKLKRFIWLCCKNCILTWDNFAKRGYLGPNICHLYIYKFESINHLFVSHSFNKLLWHALSELVSISMNMGISSPTATLSNGVKAIMLIDCFRF